MKSGLVTLRRVGVVKIHIFSSKKNQVTENQPFMIRPREWAVSTVAILIPSKQSLRLMGSNIVFSKMEGKTSNEPLLSQGYIDKHIEGGFSESFWMWSVEVSEGWKPG